MIQGTSRSAGCAQLFVLERESPAAFKSYAEVTADHENVIAHRIQYSSAHLVISFCLPCDEEQLVPRNQQNKNNVNRKTKRTGV